ncbi:MAG: type II toxin-antitoxin system death-on-curing family toxin [Gemmatimonadota bacterium]|nr:type II toxin-antitoxin system death-on-curing family toxin [Gemmatimonadota bacterium]
MSHAEPVWLDALILEALHQNLIAEYGGSAGVRDPGLVESALDRPRNKWHYEEDVDLPDLAAAYASGLVKNHGFIDGNKRIGATAIGVFLALNGYELEAPETELVAAILTVATSEWSEEELAAWIRDHTIEL